MLLKKAKTIENQGEKQIKGLENIVEKKFLDTDQKSLLSFLKILLKKLL